MRYFYLDRHVCVVYKPSGLLVVKNSEQEADLISMVKEDLSQRYHPKKIWIAPIHFLDRDVSGPIIFALSSKAATRINEQMRAREIYKSYRALSWSRDPGIAFEVGVAQRVHAFLEESHKQTNLVQVDLNQSGQSQEASMFVKKISDRNLNLLGKIQGISYLEIELETGRKHQIRALLSYFGYPIVGDAWYGDRNLDIGPKPKRIHLRSYALRFKHPVESDKLIDVKTF